MLSEWSFPSSKFDYENYLATLLVRRPSLRRSAFALRALNVELAQVLDLTSNPLTASGRFAFWSDVVEQLFANEKTYRFDGNPVARELRSSIDVMKQNVSKRHLMNMITSRASPKNLSNHPFENVSELESYSEHSIGSIYFLLVEGLVSESPEMQKLHLHLDHVASHVSKCTGIVNMLRGLVHNGKRGRCYIPNDLLLKHGASHEDFLRFTSNKHVDDVCFDLSCKAKHHLDTAYALIAEKMESANFNVFSQELVRRDTNLPYKLWWKSLVMRMKWKK